MEQPALTNANENDVGQRTWYPTHWDRAGQIPSRLLSAVFRAETPSDLSSNGSSPGVARLLRDGVWPDMEEVGGLGVPKKATASPDPALYRCFDGMLWDPLIRQCSLPPESVEPGLITSSLAATGQEPGGGQFALEPKSAATFSHPLSPDDWVQMLESGNLGKFFIAAPRNSNLAPIQVAYPLRKFHPPTQRWNLQYYADHPLGTNPRRSDPPEMTGRTSEGGGSGAATGIPQRMKPALLVDVDSDLYTSAYDNLDFVFGNNLVLPGTVIGYDDWWFNSCTANMDSAALEVCRELEAADAADSGDTSALSTTSASGKPECSPDERVWLPREEPGSIASAIDGRETDKPGQPGVTEDPGSSFPAPGVRFWRKSLQDPESTLSKLEKTKSEAYGFPPWHPLASGEGRAHLEITKKYSVRFKCVAGPCSSPRNR